MSRHAMWVPTHGSPVTRSCEGRSATSEVKQHLGPHVFDSRGRRNREYHLYSFHGRSH